MGHISDMGHSLNAIKYIVNLHQKIGSDLITVYIKSAYPFFDEDAYKEEVEECLIKHNKDYLERKLKRHLEICEQIIESWEGRFRFWEDCAQLNNEKYEVDRSISYKIHCILGERKCDIGDFYGDMLLLRYNNGKVEERNPHIPFSFLDNLWSEHKPERKPIPATDIIVGAYELVHYAKRIRDFLTACLSEEKSLQTIGQPQQKELYFTRSFTDTERKNLFDGLANGDFIPKNTNYSHFLFAFGGTEILDFKPLQWLGTIKELNYFINKFFPNEKNKWDKTVKCFIRNNAPINKKSLSTAIDKYDTLPEKSTMIDNFLK